MVDQKKIWIPEVPKERIGELAERIKPVVRMARFRTSSRKTADGTIIVTTREHLRGRWESTWSDFGELYYIKSVDLFEVAYTWDPKPADKAINLKPLCDITTYHRFGYQGLFKPSIAEVLAQIPAERLEQVVAFEIIKSPDTVDDLNREYKALNAGYHVAITRLYIAG